MRSKLTDEEKRHIEMLMAEADGWKPGMPLPEHSLEEHLKYLRLAVDDVKRDVWKIRIHFVLLVVIWTLLLGLLTYGVVRLVS